MPIYGYECPECGRAVEEYRSRSCSSDFMPPTCETNHTVVNMRRVISAPHIRIGRETENKSALKKLKKISGES